MDGTTSGGGVDLIQVEAVLLATESQHYALEPKKTNQGLTSLIQATHLSCRTSVRTHWTSTVTRKNQNQTYKRQPNPRS